MTVVHESKLTIKINASLFLTDQGISEEINNRIQYEKT